MSRHTERNKKKTTIIRKYIIAPADRVEILMKSVSSERGDYDFFDIRYGGIIVNGCTLHGGQNGEFLAAPSYKKDDNYVRDVYFSAEFSESIIKYIEDADRNDSWKSVDNDYYLKAR